MIVNNKKKLILILIMVICLVSTGCKKKQPVDNTSEEVIEMRTQRYKGFDLELPSNVDFEEDGDYTFKLIAKDWTAIVQIFYDKEHLLTKNPDKYYRVMKNMLYDVEEPRNVTIGGKNLIAYNRHGELNSVIYISDFIGNFDYEVMFYNKDNDFSSNNVDKVLQILDKTRYRIEDHEVFYYKNIQTVFEVEEKLENIQQ